MSGSWAVPSAVTGLLKRFSTEPYKSPHSPGFPPSHASMNSSSHQAGSGIYTPPRRTASPFQPPPLYPLSLTGWGAVDVAGRLLGKTLAEEIRLLVPPRLQLEERWELVYSLEGDGVSLGTLYQKCEALGGARGREGFVLVVKDSEGGLFGAYLTEAPHPSPHYYGTGECFLWRASILSASNLSHLPPPPSESTPDQPRSTTLSPNLSENQPPGVTTPERIRFKAFPYSGVNDYMMLCDATFLSVGGGDGKYGLWLDDTFERGISSPCLTFGNEGLSDEGEKFGILGVELWRVGGGGNSY